MLTGCFNINGSSYYKIVLVSAMAIKLLFYNG